MKLRDNGNELDFTQEQIDRFWSHGIRNELTGCLEWDGQLHAAGYGSTSFRVNGSSVALRAHRVAYYLINGDIPEKDEQGNQLVVRHKCNNRKCFEPTHLTLGTVKENMDDMRRSGRGTEGHKHWTRAKPEKVLRGEQVRRSILTAELVTGFRKKYRAGTHTVQDLCDEHKIENYTTVYSAIIGNTWKHLEELPVTEEGHWTKRFPDRTIKPEDAHNARFGWDEVRSIRTRLANGERVAHLAKEFNVSGPTIARIRDNKTWKELSPVNEEKVEILTDKDKTGT